MYYWLRNSVLPSTGTILLMIAPLCVYLLCASFGVDIFGGELSKRTSLILVGMFTWITLFLFVIYKDINANNHYVKIFKHCSQIHVPNQTFIPIAVSQNDKENLQFAKYVMELAKEQILSLSILSSPKSTSSEIADSDDIAKKIFERMHAGDKIANDFLFHRIISLQNQDEHLFAAYLMKKKNQNKDCEKGNFDFRIYTIPQEDKGCSMVRFPNFIVVDRKYVLLTLRQHAAQSKGVLFIHNNIATFFSSYFKFLWDEHCHSFDQKN